MLSESYQSTGIPKKDFEKKGKKRREESNLNTEDQISEASEALISSCHDELLASHESSKNPIHTFVGTQNIKPCEVDNKN